MISFRIATVSVIVGLLGFATLGFYFSHLTGGRSLDFIFTQVGLENALANYTVEDILWHRWGTTVLDSIFPLVYGNCIAIVLLRYQTGRSLTVLWAFLGMGIAFDFIENVFNMDLLNGQDRFLGHVVFTWLKFLSLGAPIFFGITAYFSELFGRIR